MADFNKAIEHILKWEGGLVDHPNDPGGLTNRGITIKTFRQYAHLINVAGTKQNLIALTEQQARNLYHEIYWQRIQGDKIDNQNIANALLDGHVNMGFNGIKIMQREAGVLADGVVGPKTLFAINSADAHTLFDGYQDAREIYYRRLAERKSKMQVFLNGWLNRVNDLRWQ